MGVTHLQSLTELMLKRGESPGKRGWREGCTLLGLGKWSSTLYIDFNSTLGSAVEP